jgi:hypothetical protein
MKAAVTEHTPVFQRSFLTMPVEPLLMVASCFSNEQWRWLTGEHQFRKALKTLSSVEDVDRVCYLGTNLLELAQQGALNSRRKPPRQPPEVERLKIMRIYVRRLSRRGQAGKWTSERLAERAPLIKPGRRGRRRVWSSRRKRAASAR